MAGGGGVSVVGLPHQRRMCTALQASTAYAGGSLGRSWGVARSYHAITLRAATAAARSLTGIGRARFAGGRPVGTCATGDEGSGSMNVSVGGASGGNKVTGALAMEMATEDARGDRGGGDASSSGGAATEMPGGAVGQGEKRRRRRRRRKRSGGEWDYHGRMLTRRVEDLGRRHQLEQIIREIAAAKDGPFPPNRITYNAAVEAHVRCGDEVGAMRLLDEMESPGGVGCDQITIGSLVKGLGKAGQLDDAFDLLEKWEKGFGEGAGSGAPQPVSLRLLVTLLGACAEAGEPVRAQLVYRRIEEGINRRLQGGGGRQGGGGESLGPRALRTSQQLCYNLLVKAEARSAAPLNAFHLLSEISSAGFTPTRLTYNTVLYACARRGRVDLACTILQMMENRAELQSEEGLLPDAVSYTSLVQTIVADAAGVPEGAAGPARPSLRAAEMGARGAAGRLDAASLLPLARPSLSLQGALPSFDEGGGGGGGPSLPGSSSPLDAAARILGGREGLDAVRHVAGLMMGGGGDEEEEDDEEEEEEEGKEGEEGADAGEEGAGAKAATATKSKGRAVEMDRVAYAALVDAFARLGAGQDAGDMVRSMEARGMRPRAGTFLAAIRAAAEGGDAGLAVALRAQMLRRAAGCRVTPEQRQEAGERCAEACWACGMRGEAKGILERIRDVARKRGEVLSPRGRRLLVDIAVAESREMTTPPAPQAASSPDDDAGVAEAAPLAGPGTAASTSTGLLSPTLEPLIFRPQASPDVPASALLTPTPAIAVSASAGPAAMAAALEGRTAALVTGDQGELLGILRAADLSAAMEAVGPASDSPPPPLCAADLLDPASSPPATVREDAPVSEAALRLLDSMDGLVPVLGAGDEVLGALELGAVFMPPGSGVLDSWDADEDGRGGGPAGEGGEGGADRNGAEGGKDGGGAADGGEDEGADAAAYDEWEEWEQLEDEYGDL